MIAGADVQIALRALDARLKTLLPEQYHDALRLSLRAPRAESRGADVQPISMGSAALKYDADGSVAWDRIWGSFCDLAMAGGPPHRGTLLEPGTEAEIDAQFGRYDEVAEEICRGVRMVTGLRSYVAPTPGWVCVTCLSDGMAAWLVRAIVMENVAVRRRGAILELPAAPHFRLEKEIKNVVTVIAKTCHYWLGHTPHDQQQAISELFATMAGEWPFVEPDLSSSFRLKPPLDFARGGPEPVEGPEATGHELAALIHHHTGLRGSNHQYAGWLGLECPSVRFAVWIMRGLVASNVLSRREGDVLFVPVNAVTDPEGTIVARAVGHIYRCASARGVT